jgi:hypothetical protein
MPTKTKPRRVPLKRMLPFDLMCRRGYILNGETIAVCTRKSDHRPKRKHWMDAPDFPRVTWETS